MMRSCAVIVLIWMAVASAEAARPHANLTTDRALVMAQAEGFADKAMGDVLAMIPAGTTTGNEVLLGVELIGNHYWVTAGGVTSASEQNYLLELDLNGNIVNQYLQPTTSTWGWRDLAWDGTYLYASEGGGVIEQIDPATGAPTGVTIAGPSGMPRALAYDPATDHFWVADFGSPIWEIDRAGNILHTYPNNLMIYGLAWDNTSPDGPFLWAWSQDGPANSMATRIDPATGLSTGDSFMGYTFGHEGFAAGAAFTSAHPDHPGVPVLVAMHQATPDTIVLYDLYSPVEFVLGPVSWTDECPTGGPTSGDGYANPGEVLHFSIPVQNIGVMTSSAVTVSLISQRPGSLIMLQDETIIPWLAVGATRTAEGLKVGVRYDTLLGEEIPLIIDVHSDEGHNRFALDLAVTTDGAFSETFGAWPPAGWTIVDNLGAGPTWNSTDFYLANNMTPGWGSAAHADSPSGNLSVDTELWTPALDLGGMVEPVLMFEAFFYTIPPESTDLFRVDISVDGGTSWMNLRTSQQMFIGAQPVIIDLGPFAGQPDCRIRFHLVADNRFVVAQVDEVYVGEWHICDYCFLSIDGIWPSRPPVAGEPVQFSARVRADCEPVYYIWQIQHDPWSIVDFSHEPEPVFVFPAAGTYQVQLIVKSGANLAKVQQDIHVGPPYDVYFYDDDGQLEGAVNTTTGRFRLILPDRTRLDDWYVDTGWFDDRAVTPEGWRVLSLHSSAGVPWIAHIVMDLDHDMVHGFFLHKEKGIFIDFTDRPGQ